MRTGILNDDSFLAHDTGAGHPERPDRLLAISRLLATNPRPGIEQVAARAATFEELVRVHAPGHVARVAATAGVPEGAFDADTPFSARSYEAARRAAGGLLALVDAVMKGEVDNGFAFVRPPGHHAEADRAMGFCLFNNVAVAAAHLRQHHRLARVLIVDWDVHHGNGTQHSFYRDPSVLFLSSHQYPFYPGTGAATEVGIGEGEGFTLNLPFPAGYGDGEYLEAYLEIVQPVARRFRPEFVLVSAGFDAHRRDPLAQMDVSENGFANLARMLLGVAREHAGNRLVAVLEGGYDLAGLTASVAAVLDEMSGAKLAEPVSPPAGARRADLRQPLDIAKHYWGI
ncbi:MAG: histone deacetylase family protein [Candidatus Binatia bacterium]